MSPACLDIIFRSEGVTNPVIYKISLFNEVCSGGLLQLPANTSCVYFPCMNTSSPEEESSPPNFSQKPLCCYDLSWWPHSQGWTAYSSFWSCGVIPFRGQQRTPRVSLFKERGMGNLTSEFHRSYRHWQCNSLICRGVAFLRSVLGLRDELLNFLDFKIFALFPALARCTYQS